MKKSFRITCCCARRNFHHAKGEFQVCRTNSFSPRGGGLIDSQYLEYDRTHPWQVACFTTFAVSIFCQCTNEPFWHYSPPLNYLSWFLSFEPDSILFSITCFSQLDGVVGTWNWARRSTHSCCSFAGTWEESSSLGRISQKLHFYIFTLLHFYIFTFLHFYIFTFLHLWQSCLLQNHLPLRHPGQITQNLHSYIDVKM